VGGKPVLLLSGEVHYFRLDRSDWRDRIVKAREAGCNAVASYIPWIFHEEAEGDIDVTGRNRSEHDLGAFIDLCRSEGLWFMARPGPFVMAEVKNEGIPDWIYKRCPNALPTTWGGKKATSKNLSYLDADFLRYARRWYDAVIPIIAQRLDTRGGNVVAVQLDNEIGMLQCWTEEADLSEDVLCEFAKWVQHRHSPGELAAAYPFDMADPVSRAKHLWDGTFPTARYFHSDYTEFTRDRFAEYAARLREFAEDAGVKDVPFVINIHGSGGGRATTFPIGISQTYRSYTQAEGYWGSSDHYLGDLTRQNAGDLYFLNAFMACVNRPEQPLSSIEFEAGTGDYGENGAIRYSGAATDFKARLSVVQGNRMLNHYLLAGGHNPLLDHPKQDGNSRVGTTGGRHGFAAPIDPEGRLDPTYFALKDTNRTLAAVAPLLADMDEEHDAIALGFLPDYYATDVKRPGPIMALATQLEAARGPLEGLVRSMLACSLSFPAVNLQADIPPTTEAIALASASCLDQDVQRRLLAFVESGGSLFLYGRMPTEDHEGRPATALLDAFGIDLQPLRQASADYFPSLSGVGWASGEPEVRAWQLQPFRASKAEPFLTLLQTDLLVGAIIPHGKGRVAVITSELPLHKSLWRGIFDRLGVKPRVRHDGPFGGLLLNRVCDSQGRRFISLINLDQEEKEVRITEDDADLFGHPVHLPGRKAKLLPLNVALGGLKVIRATTEITGTKHRTVAFRQTAVPEFVEIAGTLRTPGTSAKIVDAAPNRTVVQIAPGRGEVGLEPL
jgi:beta-galactosidase